MCNADKREQNKCARVVLEGARRKGDEEENAKQQNTFIAYHKRSQVVFYEYIVFKYTILFSLLPLVSFALFFHPCSSDSEANTQRKRYTRGKLALIQNNKKKKAEEVEENRINQNSHTNTAFAL